MQKFDFTIYLANVWLSNESQLEHYVGNHRNPHHQQFHLQELAQVIPERQEKSRHRFRGQLVELTLFYLYLGSEDWTEANRLVGKVQFLPAEISHQPRDLNFLHDFL